MVEPASRKLFGTIVLNVVVALGGIMMAWPIIWMVSASFKRLNEIYAFPPTIIPRAFTFANYQRLFTEWPFARWYLNSLLVAALITIAVLFFTSLAGLGFAKYRFRGRQPMFVLMLGSTMIPFELILIPLFIFMSRLGWTNSYAALIIPFMAPALGIFLMRQYISTLPSELMEAARIDGASEFGIYWRVMLPLMRPALAAQAILTFLGSWNSFLWPLTVLRNRDSMTLPIGTVSMMGGITAGSEPPVGASMAAATLITIPVIVVFLMVQRYYISGLTAAGVKE
jgi:ABC-type glycerol-3-phosphate transport system permease component